MNFINKYVNIPLNINVIGTSQPIFDTNNDYEKCFDILIDENIIIYIIFNDQGKYKNHTKKEKEIWNLVCGKRNDKK